MTNWRKKIAIKDLLTDKSDWQSIQDSMNKIADILEKHFEFMPVIPQLRDIPKGDDYFSPEDYANKILNTMYSIADEERIWID